MRPFLPSNLNRIQRLRLAGVGALGLHVALFASGWLVINKISIPSSDNRVMVLTLESTPWDGLLEKVSEIEETLADAQQGPASGMTQPEMQQQPPELSQVSSVPHPKATFDLQPEPSDEFERVNESVSHTPQESPVTEQVTMEVTPTEQSTLEQTTENEESNSEVAQQVDLEQESATNAELALITAETALISISTAVQAADSESTEPELTIKQRSMIERKVQQWAPKLANTEMVDSTFSWQHKGQTYMARLTHIPAITNMDLDEVMVEVKTVQDGQALSTIMRMKKLAFSNFAQFVHRWDPLVAIHDDQMNGRFHSNSEIQLASDRGVRPVFHGKVTTASHNVGFQDTIRRSTKKDIFKGGLETGVKRIKMPKPKMLFSESAGLEGQDTIKFESDTRIVFRKEGGFTWHPLEEEGAPRYEVIPEHPLYLVAGKGVTLHISGDVHGKVVVYSPRRIIIESDLRYANPNFRASDDVIGIISGRDVVIAGKKVTGEGDLTVQGSIFARGRFHVRDYSSYHTGTLHIYGSVSAGTVSATQPRYATNIQFDRRFERLKPPGFPVTDRYEIAAVNPSWSSDDDLVFSDFVEPEELQP